MAATIYVVARAIGLIEPGTDAAIFYAHRFPDPYDITNYASGDGFYYSPVAAMALYPLTLLGLPLFSAIMTGIGVAALYVVLGRWAFLGLLVPPVAIELYAANINLLLAVAIVAGFRYPSAWALPLLTKVGPGVGLIWFAIRKEWRSPVIAAVSTVLIVALSFVLAPGLWIEWLAILAGNAGVVAPTYSIAIPLALRLPAALAITVWAARSNRRWLLPLSACLSLPVMWPASLSMLVACVPLFRADAVHPHELRRRMARDWWSSVQIRPLRPSPAWPTTNLVHPRTDGLHASPRNRSG